MARNKKIILSLIIAFIFIIGILIGLEISPEKVIVNENKISDGEEIKMSIVGVNGKEEGVPGELTTSIKNGKGKILVNINNVLAGYSLQNSARVAAEVAGKYANTSLENYDISYSIKTNAESIDGPSAGSSMAISTIALLQNKKINNKIIISGSINEKGELEAIGGIIPKADAAKKANASLFLVPDSAVISPVYKKEKECGVLNGDEYCKISYVQNYSNLGIEIKKVKNVGEALKYFYEI